MLRRSDRPATRTQVVACSIGGTHDHSAVWPHGRTGRHGHRILEGLRRRHIGEVALIDAEVPGIGRRRRSGPGAIGVRPADCDEMRRGSGRQRDADEMSAPSRRASRCRAGGPSSTSPSHARAMVPSLAMAKLLQVREVPDDVHRTLKVRAAQSGTSLSEYVRAELELIAARPTPEELRARLATRAAVTGGEAPAEAIRRHRDA